MGSLKISRTIKAPIERVFCLLIDLENASQHVQGIDSIEVLTEGPIRVGTQWRETRTMMGRQATEEMTIVRFEPPLCLAAKCESCGALYESEFRCESLNNETLVTLSLSWNAISMIAKIMSPLGALMANGMKKCLEADLDDLKKAAEVVG